MADNTTTALTTDDVTAILGERTLAAMPDTTVTATPTAATMADDGRTGTSKDPQASPGYTPVFPPAVRTAVYVICMLAGIAAVALEGAGHADIGGIVATAASLLASGFGVAYNPLRV